MRYSTAYNTTPPTLGAMLSRSAREHPQPADENPETNEEFTELKIKRVDQYFDPVTNLWSFKDSDDGAVPERHRISDAAGDTWGKYCFVVVRKVPAPTAAEQGAQPTFHLCLKSPSLVKACEDVMKHIPGISWTVQPLEVCAHHFVSISTATKSCLQLITRILAPFQPLYHFSASIRRIPR